ncbi:MAG: peptidoglycan-associated lipoprotein Pal [Pseudomonadota bacterium]
MWSLQIKLVVATLAMTAIAGCSSVSLEEPAPILGGNEAGQPTGSAAPAAGTASATALPDSPRTEQGIDPSRSSVVPPGTIPGQPLPEEPLAGPDGISYGSIYFAFDSAEVGRDYQPLLEKVAEVLKTYPNQRLVIEGNTDDRGTSEYNIALGQRRAEAVLNALRILGAPETRIEPVSNGEEKPRERSTAEAARTENRRADLFFGN